MHILLVQMDRDSVKSLRNVMLHNVTNVNGVAGAEDTWWSRAVNHVLQHQPLCQGFIAISDDFKRLILFLFLVIFYFPSKYLHAISHVMVAILADICLFSHDKDSTMAIDGSTINKELWNLCWQSHRRSSPDPLRRVHFTHSRSIPDDVSAQTWR